MLMQTGSVSLFYELRGSGEPLLLVHGFPLSGELWEPIAGRLGSGYRQIVPDLRGFGRSGAGGDASMARFAVDLHDLLDHIGEPRPVVLAGLSMGGYIAFEFVRRYPDRVRALVLANTRAAPDNEEQARTRRETAERVLREGSDVVAQQMVGKLFAPAAPEELRERWHRIMAATPPQGVAAALRAMAERPDSADTLRSFERPVLVIAGQDDAIVPVSEAEAMSRTAPHGTLEIIADAGHLTPVEQPERFAAILERFLGSLPSSSHAAVNSNRLQGEHP
jgi:3-oxoadipate enol-lactonase